MGSIHNSGKITLFKNAILKKNIARDQKSKHYASKINNENKLEMEWSSVVTVEKS